MRDGKHKLLAIAFVLLFSVCGWAQNGDNPAFDSVTFPVFSLNPAPVPGASIGLVGQPGQATWYFWASANYQLGSVVSYLGSVSNAPNTLTSGNYVSIIPDSYPAGVLNVDILATTGPLAPVGACNCAVAIGLTSGGANFQSNSLSSYSVSILNPQAFNLRLTNEVTGTGATSLLLRNALTGALICNLSLGCGTGATLPPSLAFLATNSGAVPVAAPLAAGSVAAGNLSGLAAAQTKPVLDARDFGTPNGANAGTLIQAAHDSANCPSTGCVIDARGFGATDTIAGLSITKSGVEIMLGATNFSVSATISHSAVSYAHFQGSGLGVTTLTWTGNNSTSMFDLNSVNNSLFDDFLILATTAHPLTACFTAEQGTTGVSTLNTFTNVACAGTASGALTDGFRWQVGTGGDANNDSFTFNNAAFQEASHACFNNDGSTQSQLHVLNQVKCRGYGAGQYGWYGQGSFSAHDVFMAGNTVCDYQITYPNTGVTIDGAGFSISTNRFFCDSPVTTVSPVTIQGQQMEVAAVDGKVITIGGGGPYLIENNFVFAPNTVPSQFYYNPGGVPNARSIGNTIGSSLSNPLTCYGGGSACWESVGDTYTSGNQGVPTRVPETLFGPLNLGYASGAYGINGEINFIGGNSGSSTFSLALNGPGTSLTLGSNAFVNSAGLFGMTAITMPGCGVGEFPTANGTGCQTIVQPWVPTGVFNVAGGDAGTYAFSNPVGLNTTGATLLVAVLTSYSTNPTISDTLGNTWNYLTACTSSAGPAPIRIAYAYGITTGRDSFTVAGTDQYQAVILAFNTGGVTTSAVYDTSTCTAGLGTPPYQTTSGITPTAGDIVVAGLGWWGTMTNVSIAGSGSDINYSVPISVLQSGTAASYLLDASGNALNPVWTAPYMGPDPYPVPLLAAFKTTATPLLVSITPIQSPTTRITPVNFGALPSCTSSLAGTKAVVSDSSTLVWGATITGGGTPGVDVEAFCDGSNWTVDAK